MKKEVESKQSSPLSRFVKSAGLNSVITYLKNIAEKVEDLVYVAEKNVIHLLYASVLFISGIIFLSIALVFLIEDYLQLSKGWSLLIISLILFLSALLIKNQVKNNKYGMKRRSS